MRTFAFALLAALALPSFAVAGSAKVDRGHSGVMFKAHHFGAGYTWGRFNDFSGTIDAGADGSALTSMNITVKAASIDTGIEKRDKHLRSPDFFDTDAAPTITFKSTKVEDKGNGVFAVTGELSLHGVAKEYTVDVKNTGSGKLPAMMGGNEVTGWETVFKVSQSDHGMKYDGIGDVAFIHVNLEAKH